jgi:hypothetical protein
MKLETILTDVIELISHVESMMLYVDDVEIEKVQMMNELERGYHGKNI